VLIEYADFRKGEKMQKIRRLMVASVLALVVLALPSLLVAAKELASLTVSGPGINGALALSDPNGLLQLQQYGFFDTSTLTKAPQDLGAGYLVTGYLNLDGNPVPFEQGIYYPAIAGEQGYIHFTGAFDGSVMKPTSVDRWGVVSPAAAAAFSNMLAAHGVTLQISANAQTLQTPLRLPVASPLPYTLELSALACAGLALIGGGIWIRRRAAIQ
jgi:hypothetical protein